MAHFAKLGVNSKVIAVHGLDNDQMLNADNVEDETVGQQRLQEIHGWPAAMWIQTSYNTRGGVHYEANSNNPSSDQSKALRGNYAGIGYTYDSTLDAFYSPQPFSSWNLDTGSYLWEAPVAYPTGDATGSYSGSYEWNEDTTNWITGSI